MRPKLCRWVAALLAAAWIASGPPTTTCEAAVGSADYTVSSVSGLYETPPANATSFTFANPNLSAFVTLPFTFQYFGAPFDQVLFTRHGYVQFGATALGAQGSNSAMDKVSTKDVDPFGACAPLWDNLAPNASGATATYFTAGTAPNRRIVFTWEGYGPGSTTSAYASFQVKLFETGGRIEFAYKPDGFPSTFSGFTYSCGLDAPGTDTRWLAPATSVNNSSTFPASDYRFDPRLVDVTGHFVYDRFAASSSGLSGPTEAPLGGLAAEVRSGSTVVSSGWIDAAGDLAMKSQIPPPGTTPTFHVVARARACTVFDPELTQPVPEAYTVASLTSFASAIQLGTVKIDSTGDSAGAFRRAANVAIAVQRVHDWASSRVTATIAPLDVWYSYNSTAATAYSRPVVGVDAGHLRVAGPASSNPDMWDDAVIQRAYGRHVLGSVASFPPTSIHYDGSFDAATSPENAFAEGFGCFVAAAVGGVRQMHDSTSATAATSIDLESAPMISAQGDDVAGWVALALYDMVDAANETSDRIDGTLGDTAADPLRVAATVVGVPAVESFVAAWQKSGRDPYALSRTFVAHGLVADDALELNDEFAEATDVGAAPARRTGLVLNIGNEDWFRVTLPSPVAAFLAEMDFARSTNQADIRIDLYDGAGKLLGTKLDQTFGPVVLTTGALSAGTYRVRLRHAGGVVVPSYTFQAAEKLAVASVPFPAWTVGQPFSYALPITGGHPPYSFSYVPATGNGSGIGFSATTLRATGTPQSPGSWEFSLVVRDAGTPSHESSAPHRVVVHAPLQFALSGVLAFPADRPFDVALDFTGGTPPIAFTTEEGALPEGATLQGDDLRVSGDAVPPGSAKLRITGVDVAGSTDSEVVTAVACVKLAGKATVAPLAEGEAACGFWFDAVQDSVVDVTVATAKKQPKRPLQVVVTGPGGAAVAGKLKGGSGKAAATAIRCLATGRHYVVVTSASGAATALQAAFRVRPPTKGKSRATDFGDGSTVDVKIGALAGASLKFAVSVPKSAGVTLDVVGVFAPDGTAQPLADIVTESGRSASVKAKLTASGTWTLRLRGVGGNASTLSWSYTLREPPGVVYEED